MSTFFITVPLGTVLSKQSNHIRHLYVISVNGSLSHTNLYYLLDKDMISKMLERLEKLLNGVAVQRALSVHSIDHNEVVRLAELRVVRECNLPDSYTSFLDVSNVF